jgi:multimeric flavodoxin WrbA
MLGASERFTAAAVEAAEEVITKVLIIFIRPRTLVGCQGHFAA